MSELGPFLKCTIADASYLLPVRQVVAVQRIPMLTTIQSVIPPKVAGSLDYQGRLITVIDAAIAIGLRATSCYKLSAYCVIVMHRQQYFGVLIESIAADLCVDSACGCLLDVAALVADDSSQSK